MTTYRVLAAAEVPAIRVSEAVTELEALEIVINSFNQSFINVEEESATKVKAALAARTRVSEATPMSAQMQTLGQIVPGELQQPKVTG